MINIEELLKNQKKHGAVYDEEGNIVGIYGEEGEISELNVDRSEGQDNSSIMVIDTKTGDPVLIEEIPVTSLLGKTPEDFIIEGQEDKWIFVEEPPIDNEPQCNLILEEKDKTSLSDRTKKIIDEFSKYRYPELKEKNKITGDE